jgi:predicted DNA-binding transcriptional regulator AlpA
MLSIMSSHKKPQPNGSGSITNPLARTAIVSSKSGIEPDTGNLPRSGIEGGSRLVTLPDDSLLTVREVATKLNVSVRMVWRLVARRYLNRPFRMGRACRWHPFDVQACIEVLDLERGGFGGSLREKAA